MSIFLKALVLSVAMFTSAVASADAGGIPNEHACNPGNASFCPKGTAVPEISVAGLPVTLGLIATLIILRRERQKK